MLLFFPLLALNLSRLEAPGWTLAFAAVAGWALADLASGLVHWAGDRLGMRPFREHHDDPRAMTRHDFVETNGASCLGCLPLLAAAPILSLHPLPHAPPHDRYFCTASGWLNRPLDALLRLTR